MKKLITFALVLLGTLNFGFATNPNQPEGEEKPGKGSYKILKFDALNLMGIGVQKLQLAYEISPMQANPNNFPTLQFKVVAPFNSLSTIDMNYGAEVGAELRFYQRKRNESVVNAEGFFIGVGLDGGYVNFNHLDQYWSNLGGGNKEINQEYGRVRTGIYFLTGAQTKLGEKLFFDVNVGLGWSNVNVSEVDPQPEDPNWNYAGFSNSSPFYLLYQPGKGQRFYMPVSFGIGYNFAK